MPQPYFPYTVLTNMITIFIIDFVVVIFAVRWEGNIFAIIQKDFIQINSDEFMS